MTPMSRAITRILQLTAWPMERPLPYSGFHIILLLFGVPAAICAARSAAGRLSLRPNPGRAFCRLFFVCGLLLAASEVYKQLFLYEIVGGRRYDWWYFPFQLCSVPMYLCLLLPLISSPAIRRVMITFIQDFGLLGGFLALLEPSGLMHPYWTLTLHGFLWHFMLIFLGLCCAFSGQAMKETRDYLKVLPLFFLCCLIATAINVASHPYGNADMFYISPYYPNGQVVFHQIALTVGTLAGNLIYLVGVAAGGLAVHMICRVIREKGISQPSR